MIKILIALLYFNHVRSKLIGLYDDQIDNIEILDANNFNQVIYNDESNQNNQNLVKASFVEFYAHWCGGCRRYARHWKELASETKLWHQNVIRIAAINCGDYNNVNLCRQHNIQYYPTLKLFPAFAKFDSKNHDGLIIKDNHDNLDYLIKEMILFIENSVNKPHLWPNLKSFISKRLEYLFIDKYKKAPYGLLIFESDSSMIGRKLILDFSSFIDNILIRRIVPSSNPTLTNKFGINRNFLPVIYLVKNIKTTVIDYELFDQKLLKNYQNEYIKILNTNLTINDNEELKNENDYIQLKKMIFKFIEYSNLVKNEDTFQQNISINETISVQKDECKSYKQRVFIEDLETALHLMLRSEIAKKSFINESEIIDLKKWIRLLTKVLQLYY
jgi:thiol-disulfide isomerase/thioredoxin